MKIMIVEDDEIIAEELRELLINNGYEALVLKDFSKSLKEITIVVLIWFYLISIYLISMVKYY